MDRRQMQIGLWVILFILQALALGVLTVVLLKQPRVEATQPHSVQMSKAYSTVLAEKGQLPIEDQRKLLALAMDLETMLQTDARLQTSTLNVIRDLLSALLLFLGFIVVLQVLIAAMTLRAAPLKTS